MKYLLLTLLLTSCSLAKFRQPEKPTEKPKPCSTCKNYNFTGRLERCMVRFSKHGFDSKAVIDICESIYKRRN